MIYSQLSLSMDTKELINFIECVLPEGSLKWFNVIKSEMDDNNIKVVLEEKNIPLTMEEVRSKGFRSITITDFPIRGRRTLLTFKRRVWQIKNTKKLLKRDIKLSFPGTQLEQEFADFLKEDGGRTSGLTNFYRKVSKDPRERI